jgi:hypothetical protein
VPDPEPCPDPCPVVLIKVKVHPCPDLNFAGSRQKKRPLVGEVRDDEGVASVEVLDSVAFNKFENLQKNADKFGRLKITTKHLTYKVSFWDEAMSHA